MSRPVVYVAGPMTGLEWDDANDWREKVRMALPDCEVRSPLRGKAWLRQETVIESSEYPKPFGSKNAIIKRDHWDVQCADLVIANFEDTAIVDLGECGDTGHLGCGKHPVASIGTCFELAWAYEFGTPIISIIPEGNIHRHAFIAAASLEIVSDLKTAISLARTLLNLGAHDVTDHAKCCY
jgi:hypothetical protein